MILYSIPQGSCYLQIVKVRYQGPEYMKAIVRWYSKPGKTFLREEKDLKIPNKCFQFWEKVRS